MLQEKRIQTGRWVQAEECRNVRLQVSWGYQEYDETPHRNDAICEGLVKLPNHFWRNYTTITLPTFHSSSCAKWGSAWLSGPPSNFGEPSAEMSKSHGTQTGPVGVSLDLSSVRATVHRTIPALHNAKLLIWGLSMEWSLGMRPQKSYLEGGNGRCPFKNPFDIWYQCAKIILIVLLETCWATIVQSFDSKLCVWYWLVQTTKSTIKAQGRSPSRIGLGPQSSDIAGLAFFQESFKTETV